MAGIVVKPRARILHGHDWVFSSEVLKVFGNPADGDVISLKDGKDRLIGAPFTIRNRKLLRAVSRGDGRTLIRIFFGAASLRLPNTETGETSIQNCAAWCGAKATVFRA
jgi:hypothetical protein